MPRLSTVFDVLIASPSDVEIERKEVQNIIANWNAVHSQKENVILNPVLWETHSWPKLGDRPQAILNKQIVNGCDILIGFFWTRIGTPTGLEESGTVEEIKKFSNSKKQISLYFSMRPITPDLIDNEQYEKLKKFKQECKQLGLVSEYVTIDDLKDKLTNDITRIVDDLQNRFGFIPRIGMSGNFKEFDIKKIHKRIYIFLNRFELELERSFSRHITPNDNTGYISRSVEYGAVCGVLNWAYTDLWEIYGDMIDLEIQDHAKKVETAIKYIISAKEGAEGNDLLGSGMGWMSFDYVQNVKPHVEKFIDTLTDCLISLDKKIKEDYPD
jgi:hypothetical protein